SARPSWSPTSAPLAARPFDAPIEIAMDGVDQVIVDVSTDSLSAAPFVLDTGAWWTAIDEEVALRMGVVPTGEPPFEERPPWLPPGTAWVGLIDHMSVAGVEVDGARVLVQRDLGSATHSAGLLGMSFIRNIVVDLDAPARVTRFVPRDQFQPTPEM